MQGYREEDYYDDGAAMNFRASHCNRFSRRGDMSVFNMSDYQSCENCRHMTADQRCVVNMDSHFFGNKGME